MELRTVMIEALEKGRKTCISSNGRLLSIQNFENYYT